MIKINFRGEEISKLETETLIYKLKLGLTSPNLNEQEQKNYEGWKKIIKDLNLKALTEKEYLIGELSSRIKIAEDAKKRKYCEKHEHIPKSEHVSAGQSGTRVYGECKRCGMGYDRNLTQKEWENFNEFMNTPMTI